MKDDNGYVDYGCLTAGTISDYNEPFENIFKKSEHEEIMDKLNEIERKLDDFPRIMPMIPYLPYVSPYVPYLPYPDDVWYPKPYYYGYEVVWTDTTGGCIS